MVIQEEQIGWEGVSLLHGWGGVTHCDTQEPLRMAQGRQTPSLTAVGLCPAAPVPWATLQQQSLSEF